MAGRSLVTLASALALVVFAAPVRAQDPPKPEAPKDVVKPERTTDRRDRGPSTTLRVQVVIARYQDDKKLASLPYLLVVTADGSKARMRMGVDTPVPVTAYTGSDPGASKPATSFQYRNVGTNIDCGARDLGDGRYQLTLSVENSSALTGAGSRIEGAPLFRRFEATLDPLLRDGQSVQTIASTDPVTGEVVKIDVTLNVAK